jgi:hypothetical protein
MSLLKATKPSRTDTAARGTTTATATRCTRQPSQSRGRHRQGSRQAFDPQSQQSQQSQQSTAGDDPQTQTPVLTADREQLLAFFPRLKRSLADSKQQLLALAKHVGVSQPACTAAFSQFLRDIHPAYVLPGQLKFTTNEAATLDDLFRTDARWSTGGNLATLADVAAKNLNRLRPQDAPQLTAEMILNRRQVFRRSTTTQGVLAHVPLPGLVALGHFFSKQLRATIALLQSCVEDERVVIALDRAGRDKAFMETYLSQFSASIGEILQFARRQVSTQNEHDISNRRFQLQTLSEQRHRRPALRCLRRLCAPHCLSCFTTAKGVHEINKLPFLCDCALNPVPKNPRSRGSCRPPLSDSSASSRHHRQTPCQCATADLGTRPPWRSRRQQSTIHLASRAWARQSSLPCRATS